MPLHLPLSPRHRYAFAFLLGCVSAAGFAPLDIFPVYLLGVAILCQWVLATSSHGQAFLLCLLFAWGQLICGLYWVGIALLVDAAQFGWLLPFAILGLPLVLALFYGLAGLLWSVFRSRQTSLGTTISNTLLFALWWFAAELARSHLFTGFPWNIAGTLWANTLPILQLAAYTGTDGLGFLTITLACSLGLGVQRQLPRKMRLGAFLLPLLFLGIAAWWGAERIAHAPSVTTGQWVRLVQPNIPQTEKWQPSEQAAHVQRLIDLSARPIRQKLNAIIWPETALPLAFAADSRTRTDIMSRLPTGSVLLTGAVRLQIITPEERHYYNSLLALNDRGTVVTFYDKVHLVPFGEYVPFRGFAPIAAVAAGMGDFSRGPQHLTLHLEGLPPFSPLICYEAIFSGAVTSITERPELLINITNDGWYGNSSGPYQHLAQARMRAVEEGLPLLRVANTGVSAVIDGYGRLLQALPLEQMGVIDAEIPAALPPTFFSRYSQTAPLCLALMILIFIGGLRFHRNSNE